MTVPTALDERFRAAAAESGQLDVAYETVDSPIGPLLVAASERGVCRISFDPVPEGIVDELARVFGVRVLRAPRREVDHARRELDEYFAGTRQAFSVPLDLRVSAPFAREILERLARVPFGETTTYGNLATAAGRPRAARAVGTVMNRNPIPIVLPCHRVVGATGSLVGYAGGLDRKAALLRLEGVVAA
jgi:methylated-DNA-[protein]-cysteine S-methyltransferase